MTTTGMLLRKPLIAAATARASISATISPAPPATLKISPAPRSRTPVRIMLWPMTRSAKTVIRAGLAKP